MGQSSSLAPGGGSVYQQLGGGRVGTSVATLSTGHKVYLDIAIVIWSSGEVDIEHELVGKKAERTS